MKSHACLQLFALQGAGAGRRLLLHHLHAAALPVRPSPLRLQGLSTALHHQLTHEPVTTLLTRQPMPGVLVPCLPLSDVLRASVQGCYLLPALSADMSTALGQLLCRTHA